MYGVSIIDENNIWAVGEIYRNDSTGQSDDTPYNAMHWDGQKWNEKKVMYGNFTPPINSILAFGQNDIWLDPWIYWSNNEFQELQIPDVLSGYTINKMWGRSNNGIYIGGTDGNLVFYNGETWQKIESGTELDIEDIHGNEEQGVVAVASKLFKSLDKEILRINEDQTVTALSTEGIPEPISGIWFDETGVAYIIGSGMFKKSGLEAPVAWQAFHQPITNNYMDAIDANGLNDIVVSGNSGEILHFNGAAWTSYHNWLAGTLYDIDIHQDLVVAVGYDGGKAFITMGKRE